METESRHMVMRAKTACRAVQTGGKREEEKERFLKWIPAQKREISTPYLYFCQSCFPMSSIYFNSLVSQNKRGKGDKFVRHRTREGIVMNCQCEVLLFLLLCPSGVHYSPFVPSTSHCKQNPMHYPVFSEAHHFYQVAELTLKCQGLRFRFL